MEQNNSHSARAKESYFVQVYDFSDDEIEEDQEEHKMKSFKYFLQEAERCIRKIPKLEGNEKNEFFKPELVGIFNNNF